MSVDVGTLLAQAREALTVKHVFGEPIERDGLTIVPVAKLRGCGGGGAGEGPEATGKGWGLGYGLSAKASGVYEIKGGEVRFIPVVDVNRIILVAGVVAVAALLCGRPRAKLSLKT